MIVLRCCVVSALALASVRGAGAQGTGIAAVDSASAARAAFSAASQAVRSGDLRTAQRELDRAAAAWPTQPVYLWNRAVIAARRSDTTTARAALRAYADLGLGRSLADTVFNKFRSLPWFPSVATRHDENRGPMANSVERARLVDSTLWPEGVDYDPRTRRLYVTSVRRRSVLEVSARGEERFVVPPDGSVLPAVLSARVDAARGLLWLGTSAVAGMHGYAESDSAAAALIAVRIDDGQIVKRYDLARTTRHALGDVALSSRGDVFTSDSSDPVLYWLKPDADTLEAIRHPLIRSPQGIAVVPGENVVFVADYSHGILRVDLATRRVTRLDDAPGATSLGCDGLTWYQGSLIAVQNGVFPPRIVRFDLDASRTRLTSARVIDRNTALADEPTAGVMIGREFVYVANSQWEKYAPDGARRPGTTLSRPLLLSILLDR
jgi:sugar lactone lactonase YvrE